MIIDLKTITHAVRRFEFSLNQGWWDAFDPPDRSMGLNSSLQADIEIYKTGDRYVLSGEFNGGFHLTCDRCLETYNRDIHSVFKIVLTPPLSDSDRAEIELSEKDMQVGFISNDAIDLREIVREQVYLSFPAKSLCREGCLGLCPECGADLNRDPCQCSQNRGHPGFSKLKQLKIQGE
jgi:uncharacterized protein